MTNPNNSCHNKSIENLIKNNKRKSNKHMRHAYCIILPPPYYLKSKIPILHSKQLSRVLTFQILFSIHPHMTDPTKYNIIIT